MAHRGYDCDHCEKQLQEHELAREYESDTELVPRFTVALARFTRVDVDAGEDDDGEPTSEPEVYQAKRLELCGDCFGLFEQLAGLSVADPEGARAVATRRKRRTRRVMRRRREV